MGRADRPIGSVSMEIAMSQNPDDDGIVVLFYAMTLVKGPGVLIRPI
jgi:hypothetical protein